MTKEQCEAAARLIEGLSWPEGVRCRTRLVNTMAAHWAVRVRLSAGGEAATPLVVAPPGRPDVDHLMGTARSLAAAASPGRPAPARSGGGRPPSPRTSNGADDDRPEPRPAWLTVALARIDGASPATPEVRAFARRIVAGLEFEGVVPPSVDAVRGAVVLTWSYRGRDASVSVLDAGTYRIYWNDGRTILGVEVAPAPGRPPGFSAAREVVAWCLRHVPPDAVNLLEMCRGRRVA